ncbi:MAG: hypothetical protein II625_00830 [Bacilli bacterium]|nr:hypothetical protein [Bacilli bacterium]
MMKKKEKSKKVINEEVIKSQIPDEVKIALGKFYIFSMLYLIFFGVVFPFMLIDSISLVSQILAVIFLTGFYVYMLIDVKKKKMKFTSTLFVILTILVFILISFSIVKMCI